MKLPTILMIVSSVLLPLQLAAAVDKEPKKPTSPKKVTKKTDKKASPAKKTPTSTKKKTSSPKKATPSTKSASHISLASPELQKKAASWVKALSSGKKTKLLGLLNKGKVEDFKDFPGVGPAKFANMKKGRPFKKIEDLANINGFGEATFKAVVDHAKKMK